VKKILTIGALVIGLLIVQFLRTRSDREGACHQARESVDRFTADTKAAPKSAEELVMLGYLDDARLADECELFPPILQ